MITALKLFRFLGPTLLFFGTFVVLPPLLMSYFSGTLDMVLFSIYLVCIGYSVLVLLTLRKRKFSYSPRDGFIITFVTWVLISLLASVPFISNNVNFFDAFFEAVSGLTTTGSTVLSDLNGFSEYMLMYRQLLQ